VIRTSRPSAKDSRLPKAQAICASARVRWSSACEQPRCARAPRSHGLSPRRACPANAGAPLDDVDGRRLGERQQRFDDAPAKDAWSIVPSDLPL
jgi:hypothetical protein